METRILDCRGLSCPLPILRATRLLRELAAGERLRVLATDANAPRDFAALCEVSTHELVNSSRDEQGVYVIELRVGAPDGAGSGAGPEGS